MEMIPTEWVDRLFELMLDYFGEKWEKQFTGYPKQIDAYKMLWRNGLTGLTKDEIKKGLKIAKQIAQHEESPPHVLDFYHYSKGAKIPFPPIKKDLLARNSRLAIPSINMMKRTVRGTPSDH